MMYQFNENTVGVVSRKPHHTRRHRRVRGASSSDSVTDDGNNSLTYSAASSVNSVSSQSVAGQSTDSSFADIMKVLDLQDRDELAALMKKEGMGEYRKMKDGKKSEKDRSSSGLSVTSSLAYSTDAESALESTLGGEALLQTITGQPSDGYGPDGGGTGGGADAFESDNSLNILFAPADPFDKKKKKKSAKAKRDARSSKSASVELLEPKSIPESPVRKRNSPKMVRKLNGVREESSSGGSDSTPVPRSPPTRKRQKNEHDEIWWAKWWMCGFSDAFRDLAPKF